MLNSQPILYCCHSLYALKSKKSNKGLSQRFTSFALCNILPVMFSFIKVTLIKHGVRQLNQEAE